MRRETTPILDRKENGGMHRQKAYRNIKAMFEGHGYTSPRLYHIVIMENTPRTEEETIKRFRKAVQAICRQLRRYEMPTRWRAALERDDEKGLHFHVFMLIESALRSPRHIMHPGYKFWERRREEGGKKILIKPLRLTMESRGLEFYLCPPRADIHYVDGIRKKGNEQYFARPTKGPKLEDCLEWVSYLVKARSKPDDIRNIYYSSRDSKHVQQGKSAHIAVDTPPPGNSVQPDPMIDSTAVFPAPRYSGSGLTRQTVQEAV